MLCLRDNAGPASGGHRVIGMRGVEAPFSIVSASRPLMATVLPLRCVEESGHAFGCFIDAGCVRADVHTNA